MGVGRNMAYKKDLFFNMKGFASMLHIQSGDDDLFVNKAATKQNTRIEVSSESITESSISENFKNWFIQKERHLSTSSYYRSNSKLLIGMEVFSRGLFYSSFIALLSISPLLIALITLSVFLVRFLTQLIIVNLSAKRFNERKFHYHLVFFDIILPLISLFGLINNKLTRKTKYQWK
jgi:hypothetical protein